MATKEQIEAALRLLEEYLGSGHPHCNELFAESIIDAALPLAGERQRELEPSARRASLRTGTRCLTECAQRTAEAVEAARQDERAKMLAVFESELKYPHIGDGWVRLLIDLVRKE